MDKRHGEPICAIVAAYIKERQWQTAYLFSAFGLANYHDRKPVEDDIEDVEDGLYEWRLLFFHAVICAKTGRLQESSTGLSNLRLVYKKRTFDANPGDLTLIKHGIRLLKFNIFRKRLKIIFVGSKSSKRWNESSSAV